MGNGASIGTEEGAMAQQSNQEDELNAPFSPSVVAKKQPAGQVASPLPNSPMMSYGENETVEDEEDVEPMDILFQFIPFYGKGDGANDSLVRSTLLSLSIDDIDRRDEYGNSLLLLACQYACEDLVRIMLNKGADPNALNSSGVCGLHFVSYGESMSKATAKLLLQNGANPELAETTYGCTPLHYCAGTGDIDFCKLLISHGAQVQTLDYYNYTSADYARDAHMMDLYEFLQNKIKAAEQQQLTRGGGSFGSGLFSPQTIKSVSFSPMTNVPLCSHPDWTSQIDPATKARYYTNSKTGEVLWEHDLQMRLADEPMTPAAVPATPVSNAASTPKEVIQSPAAAKENDPALMAMANRTRLIGFFGKYDPAKLPQVDSILQEYKSKEDELIQKLCIEYGVSADDASAATKPPATPAMDSKVSALAINSSFTLGKSTPISNRGGSTPGFNHAELIASTIANMKEKEDINRIALEKKFEEERAALRASIVEKEILCGQLQSEIDGTTRHNQNLEVETVRVKERLKTIEESGGNSLHDAEERFAKLHVENDEVNAHLDSVRGELRIEREKLSSLESTLSTLASGQAEKVLADQLAAEERAKQQRVKDAAHAAEVKEMETGARKVESDLRKDIAFKKKEANTTEENLRQSLERLRHEKEREISELRKEMVFRKAKFKEELTKAETTASEAVQRANVAEATQAAMQDEIIESKKVHGFNAQLHKYLNREQVVRKKLHNEMEDMKGKIRVYIRIRPFSKKEMERGCQEAVFRDGKQTVLVNNTDSKKTYDYDQVFGGMDGNSQVDVFRDTKHLIMSVIDGYNVCIFAYGQTGAGKSFTMIGGADIATCLQENGDFDSDAGITPRAVSELFRLLNERSAQVSFEVEVQMFQLYRDGLEDLLKETGKGKKKSGDPLKDAAGGPLKVILAEFSATGLVQVEGSNVCGAKTPVEVMHIFAKGASRRTTASTQMNAESSRSHLIFCITVKLTNKRTGVVSVGKLTLVDLAGSERVDKSGAAGDVLKEAQSINKSLSALGDVIASLTSGSKHVPYRNHPLTMLMSDSLGGNAKTLVFVNASPADYNVSETTSSLGFASRCKDITNAVSTGGSSGVQAAQMSALKKELAKLKKGGNGGKSAKAPGPPGGLARPTTSHQD